MTQTPFQIVAHELPKLTLTHKIDVLTWFFDPGRNDPYLCIPDAVDDDRQQQGALDCSKPYGRR